MKKFYLGALGCLLAMGASAQTLNPVGNVSGSYFMMGAIGKEFTNTGKGIVYTMEEGDDAVEFKLYDEQFNATQTLSVKTNENYNRRVTERREVMVTEGYKDYSNRTYRYIDWWNTYKYGNVSFEVDSIAEFIIDSDHYNGVDSICIMGDSVKLITDYYNEETEGKKYPSQYYIYKEQQLYRVSVSYKSAYTGEWVTEVEHYGSEYAEFLLRYYDMDAPVVIDEAASGYLFGTQSLFNNDSKLEFVRTVYEELPDDSPDERDRDNDGEVDYRVTYYDDRTKAFEIINEDNEVLTTINCPANSKYSYPYLFKWGNNRYLAILSSFRDYYNGDYYEYTYSWNIYLIEKGTNSIRKVNAAPLMSAMPVLAERNSTVNVTLDAETVKNGGELVITDSNGRTVGRSYVEAGQTSVPVTTDRMGSGVYNITLTEKGQKVENARIIVK